MDLIETAENPDLRRHPWEVARGKFFTDCLINALQKNEATSLLDVGGGDGFMAHRLGENFEHLNIVCWDINYDSGFLDKMAHAYPRIRFTQERPEGTFDMLMLLDVLEHVKDDAGFLTDLVQEQLVDGGQALISVPAWPQLFSHHDHHLKHFRRYTPKTGSILLEASGLKILKSGGLFHSLVVPRAIGVIREKMFGPRPFKGLSDWEAGAATTSLIQGMLSGDNWMTKALGGAGLSLPGLSWWALCQK